MSSGVYNRHTGYHNRRSIRLAGYAYSSPGYYFVTLCIHDRKQDLFGEVVSDAMIVNDYGMFVQQCWHEIPEHFPHVTLDEFVVMPNHVHGIIRIASDGVGVSVAGGQNAGDQNAMGIQNIVGVQNFEPLQKYRNSPKHQYQRIIPRSIGSIIRGFKIGVTTLIRRQIPNMVVWQRNFYEHVIRDDDSLGSIRGYIRRNPFNWSNDSENHINREVRDFDIMQNGDEE